MTIVVILITVAFIKLRDKLSGDWYVSTSTSIKAYLLRIYDPPYGLGLALELGLRAVAAKPYPEIYS